MDCLFCKIASGDIPAKKVFEDEVAIAIHDINPQAPVHLLVLPRKHIASLAHMHSPDEDRTLLGNLLASVNRIAAEQLLIHGYRIVINTGSDGGQTVNHLHFHLLGGRGMEWPPG
jgi:histidine triad (HIT) family protein